MPEGRKLPEDPGERDKVIGQYSLPAGMLVSGISSILEAAGGKPLSALERKEGATAWGAWLYENEAKMSGTMLILMWSLAVLVPRIIEIVKQRKEASQKQNMDAMVQKQRVEIEAGTAPKAA